MGDEAYPLTVFQYTLTHERTHPATFLRDYQGYLQADAYNGYDGIYLESDGKIIEVGCWQHARKRFKAAQASDLRAQVAMAFIKSMYAIEKRIRQRKTRAWADLSIDERAERVRQVRQAETVPLLHNFGVWLRQTSGNVLPKSELGEAIRYTLNQWDALQVFTTCGLLDADNNEAERGHRGIAIGRNYAQFCAMRSCRPSGRRIKRQRDLQLRIIWSQSIEEVEQLAGLRAAAFRWGRRVNAVERAPLHLQIGFDVLMGRLRTFVSQPQGDDRHIYTGLKQVHGCGVTQRVGRHVLTRQGGASDRCHRDRALQPVFDAGSRERAAVPVWKQRRCVVVADLHKPLFEDIRGSSPQRDRSLLTPFSMDMDVRCRPQMHVAAAQVDRLRYSSAGIVHEREHRTVPASAPGCGVGCV